jgi:hypothetical protein
MKGIRVLIRRYVDSASPGWVDCAFVDAFGREVRFVEKVPVVTAANPKSEGPYPQPGVIACQVLKNSQDSAGRSLATISTEKPWGVESVEGQTMFEVFSDQLVEI